MFKHWLLLDESTNSRMRRLLQSGKDPILQLPRQDQNYNTPSDADKAAIHHTPPAPSAPAPTILTDDELMDLPVSAFRPALVYASPQLPEVFVPGRGCGIPRTVELWLSD